MRENGNLKGTTIWHSILLMLPRSERPNHEFLGSAEPNPNRN